MDSIRRHRLQVLAGWSMLFVLSFALLNGCSKKEVVDPYAYGSLREVTRGHIESIDYLFEIDAPEFLFIHGNAGIVRFRHSRRRGHDSACPCATRLPGAHRNVSAALGRDSDHGLQPAVCRRDDGIHHLASFLVR